MIKAIIIAVIVIAVVIGTMAIMQSNKIREERRKEIDRILKDITKEK